MKTLAELLGMSNMQGDIDQKKSAMVDALRGKRTGLLGLAEAKNQWGFLNDKPMSYIETPREGMGYAETWPVGEPGSPELPRPASLPLGLLGVQVFKPGQFGPNDIAGEALHTDPYSNQVRAFLQRSFTPGQMREVQSQPDYQAGDVPVSRRLDNATDAAIRGYTAGQWPKEAVDRFFTPTQRDVLDKLKTYMKTGKR